MHIDIIAQTHTQDIGFCFSSFGPYVPCLAEDGSLSFWAASDQQESLIARWNGQLETLAVPPLTQQFCSHPAHNQRGELAVYIKTPEGIKLALYKPEHKPILLSAPLSGTEIGPLGPSINAHGDVAFRSWNPRQPTAEQGVHCLNLKTAQVNWQKQVPAVLGLPVMGPEAQCLYQVKNGPVRQLYLNQQCIHETSTSAGNFASINRAGEILWSWQDNSGRDQLYRFHKLAKGQNTYLQSCLLTTKKRFQSIRGGLSPDQAPWLIFATPAQGVFAGRLGIYQAPDEGPCAEEDLRCLLSQGQNFETSEITSFALNPVSYNQHGELAVRLTLLNGREYIVKLTA